MADFVVLRLGREHSDTVEWIVADDDGTRRGQPMAGTLAEAAVTIQSRPVIVLVPATETLTTTIDLPIKSRVRLNNALPYALEEQVADDVDTLHFAAGDQRDSGRRPVAAVARTTLDAWLERLAEAGIQPWKLVPENYGLARIPGTMTVLVDGDMIMFNDGDNLEFVMQGCNPSDALVAAGALSDRHDEPGDALDPSGHLVVYCSAADEERFTHDWIALRHELHSVDINLLPDGVLPRLAVTAATGTGVNLLQGRYGPKADYGSYVRPWRTAAALLLGLVMVGFAGKGVDYYRLTQEAATLEAQFAEEFRFFQPGNTTEIRDPVGAVASIKRALGTSEAPQVFLPTMRELSVAMSQNKEAAIEAISYRAGVIDVRITSPDVATLDNIQKAVSASGQFQASIQSTDQVADRISSRLQIREAGS
jgi:general secretion pathway protein L